MLPYHAMRSLLIFFVLYSFFLQGVGDGCQPILSRYYGEGNTKSLKINRGIAYRFTFVLSLVCTVITILLRNYIPVLFGTSESVAEACANAFPIFSAGLIILRLHKSHNIIFLCNTTFSSGLCAHIRRACSVVYYIVVYTSYFRNKRRMGGNTDCPGNYGLLKPYNF